MAAVCAMLTLASCGNDIELTQVPVKGEYKVTFTASQEGSATRTAVDGSNVVWQTGDAITVFDGGGNNCMFELATGAGATVGEFVGTIQTLDPKSYCAVYPAMESATIDSDYGISGLSLPVEQVATPDGFDPQAAIMTARNDNAEKITSESEDLSLGEFKHVCAFVKVTTTEPYDKITFTAKGGERIAGGFTVTLDENGISTVTPAADASTTVSLVPVIEGTKIAAGTYLIAVLPGTLTEGFTMSCFSIDEEHDVVTTMVRSYNGTTSAFSRRNAVNMGTVEEGVTAATWTRNTQKYVDLGLISGTKWATCNVGATSPEESGDFFAWGETNPAIKNEYTWQSYKWCESTDPLRLSKYNSDSSVGIVDNKIILEECDDAAHINWGSAWRTPTKSELEELLGNCYWEWTDDYENTGVTGYIVYRVDAADNSDQGKVKSSVSNYTPHVSYNVSDNVHIFLPVAGFYRDYIENCDHSEGNYWPATFDSGYSVIYLKISLSSAEMRGNPRSAGRSVRAVLK